MTIDHNALLQAILVDPSDDLPRLAYADWCEEQGRTDCANFIRAQLALFHGPRGYKTEEECPRSLLSARPPATIVPLVMHTSWPWAPGAWL